MRARKRAGQARDTKGRRLSDAEVMVRRGDVERMLAEGRFDFAGRAELAERWEVSDSQLWRDRQIIQEDWNQQAGTPIPITRARQAASARRAMAMGFGQSDPSAAVSAIKEEANLLGTHAPKLALVEHTGSVDLIVRTPEEKAMSVLRALPLACKVLGIDAPVLDIPVLETLKAADGK